MKSMFAIALLVLATALAAQEPQMSPEMQKMMEAVQKAGTPGDPHKKLDAMIGTWDVDATFWMEPGAPPMKSTGTSENRWILGGRYIEQRFRGDMMGQVFEGLGYTGYDNIKKQYFSTWMDTMSTGVMWSSSKDAQTFTGKMDDPLTRKATPFKTKVIVVDNDKHVFEMWNPPMKGGKNYKSMELVYTRKK